MDLNYLSKIAYEITKKRHDNGARIDLDTRSILKHTATEVVEAAEAYNSMVDGVANMDIFSSELADIIICVLGISGKENIDIEKAILDGMEKNRKRAEKIGDKL